MTMSFFQQNHNSADSSSCFLPSSTTVPMNTRPVLFSKAWNQFQLAPFLAHATLNQFSVKGSKMADPHSTFSSAVSSRMRTFFHETLKGPVPDLIE